MGRYRVGREMGKETAQLYIRARGQARCGFLGPDIPSVNIY